MLWVLIRITNDYPQHMFSSRNNKTINTFRLKKAPCLQLCILSLFHARDRCVLVNLICKRMCLIYQTYVWRSQLITSKSRHCDCLQYILQLLFNYNISHDVRKCSFGHVRPAKTWISLRMRTVWSVFAWRHLVNQGYKVSLAERENSDQTIRAVW